MANWVIFIFISDIFKGLFQCAKKKAVEKNTIYEILASYCLITFLIVAFTSKNVFDLELSQLLSILGKTLIVVVAWLLNLYALSRMPVSLYGVINLSTIIFSIIMSVIFLGEQLTLTVICGMLLVLLGLFLVNRNSKKDEKKETSLKVIAILLASCFLNSISSIIDKKILGEVTSDQFQFWFLLFSTIIYWWILFVKKEKVKFKNIKKNHWILITAISLAVGDKFLFMANAIPESKVSIMTILIQLSVIEIIILGKILFKEKNIIKKLLCSILIILGIAITLI